jgi:DNA-binding response OmpR family regulator
MAEPTPRSVLIVEDDPGFGSLLREVLEAAGHDVRLAATSAAAVTAVATSRPDVLCVDIDLPDGTGWGLLDELEARSMEPAAVVVMSAGIGAAKSRNRPRTVILPKPFPIDSLLRLVSGGELSEI